MSIRRKILTGLLIMLICTEAALFGGSAVESHAAMRDVTYSFDMNITVTGTVGSTITEQTCTISINGGVSLVRPLAAGTDISKWFMGSETPLPAGLKVTVAEDAAVGAKSIKVKFSGTVYGASKDTIMIVPQNIYFDANESDWYAYANTTISGTNHKFNIVRNTTVPSGYSGVGSGLYVKDQVSGTTGWKLTGEKGVALTQNYEMQVFIKGNFIVPLSARTVVSDWFTGELSYYNQMFNASMTSVLPDGVTVRLKEDVPVGANSFTLVFSGTPEKGSVDLIAFRIPKGVVSFDKGGSGDYQEGCCVTNVTGKYCYNISTDNEDEFYSEWVKITYPEATLEAGKPVTEADNLIATYEIIGNVDGKPITFKGIELNHSTVRGICYQNPASNNPSLSGLWNDHITTSTGLEGTIIEISEDGRTIKARLTGTPKKKDSYPYTLKGRGFILNQSYNTAGHLITGYTSGESTITIVEPTLNVTIDKDVTIVKAEADETPTITNRTFTLSLGGDKLAKALAKGESIPLFYPETHNQYDMSMYNGFSISAAEAAAVGDSQIQVYIGITKSQIKWAEKGYLRLAFPKEYITRLANYGTQDFYDIPFSRIYEDIALPEKPENVLCSITPKVVNGKLNFKYIYDENNAITDIDLKPIGTEKIYFDITIAENYYTTMKKAYNAGDSVTDFINMYFDCFESESPFYKDYYLKQFKGSDFKMFDIYTTEDIAIEPGNGPRVLHLMMDLSKVYAVREFQGTAHFQLAMKGMTIQVKNSKFVFDITESGLHSNGTGDLGTVENTEPDGQPDIWVNGKDNKKDSIYYKTTSRTLSDLISELPDGCKYIVSVTGTDIDDVANAFGTGGKAKKSDVAKASIKAKDGLVNVSAGKKAGTARIWVAAFNSKEKKIVESKYFDVAVGTAPKKMYLTQYGKAEKAEAVKSIILNQGDSEKVFVNAEGTVLSAYTSFTWDSSRDTDGLLDIGVSENTAQSATITPKSAPSDGKVKKIGISVINNESGKKVTLSVIVSNAVQSIDGLDKAYALGSAADAAVEETLDYSLVCSSKDATTTDKIKVYVTTALEEGEGYTLTNGKKFAQSSSSKSKIKVTYKDGAFTLKAPKKTADGSKVRVLIVTTHADKTVEVFESGVITVGPVKENDSN